MSFLGVAGQEVSGRVWRALLAPERKDEYE
jgi:hypothetical protein